MSTPRTFHVNVYKGGWFGAHWTRDFADSAARSTGVERRACVEVTFADGDGLGQPASPDDEARSLIRNSIETLVRKMAPWTREEADRMLLAMGVAPVAAEGPVASPEAEERGIWRQGRRVPRNIYLDDDPVCMVASGELAAAMVAALNAGSAAGQRVAAWELRKGWLRETGMLPSKPAERAPVDDTRLAGLITAACARFNALSPAEQEAELLAQQESYVRGEMGMRDADRRRTGRPRNNDHEDDCA